MDFPLYVDETVKSAADRLRMLPDGRAFNFAFLTDTHNCTAYTDRTLYALNEINKKFKIEFVCFGGDYLCNNSHTEREEALRQHRELEAVIKKYSGGVPVIVIKGNHDDNPFGEPENRLNPSEIYDILMKPQEKFCAQDSNIEKSMYGYFDVPEKKLRAVYLNVFDPEYKSEGGRVFYQTGRTDMISEAQLKWLSEKAFTLPEKDYEVAVFAHTLPVPSPFPPSERFFGGDAVMEILSAFREGKSYSAAVKRGELSYNISCDFSEQGQGSLIGFFCGHYHRDWLWKVSDIQVITNIAAASDNFGTSLCGDGKVHAKTRGSGEESAFSVYRVYPDTREVYCIRCGAGPDLSYKY